MNGGRTVYLVDGARTPFLKARGEPGPFSPVDLAVQCGRPLLLRQGFPAEAIDQVVLGCVNVVADEMNPARVAALRLGLGAGTPAFTVQINCGSGMLSIDTACERIAHGRAEIVLAGGTESLSHAPLVFSREATEWFADLNTADNSLEKLRAAIDIRPDFFRPVIGLERGLTDPIVDLGMGQTAEKLAQIFDIGREAMDRYAVDSHRRLARAQEAGYLEDEVLPAFARDGETYAQDDGVRPNTTAETLAGLRAAFDRPWGRITAGNASQVTDGASWTILASEEAVEKHGLEPLAAIRDSAWSALDPSIMGLGPVLCATEILKRRNEGLGDIDLWEINEAFAAQVLACLAAWRDDGFCREVLGLNGAMGEIPRERLNVDGGAISLGHPVGTSGNRITLHLANAMRRLGLKRGIATECIGGGQGGAMLLEAV